MTKTTKISYHFYFHEFFSPGIWQSNNEVFLRKLIDPRLLLIIEKIRVDLNKPVYINNWKWGGNSKYRGFRPKNTTVGALYSQHKFGRALDFQVKDFTNKQVHNFILKNEKAFFKMGLTRIESVLDAPTWVHIDLAWTNLKKIKVFRA